MTVTWNHRVAVAVLALLLAACGSFRAPDELGRYPVTLVAVERVSSGVLGPRNVAARTVAPDVIHVLREHQHHVGLVAHELRHIVQWNEHGPGYLIAYNAQVATHGYHDAPYEVDARAAEMDPWYRAWARDVIAAHAEAP